MIRLDPKIVAALIVVALTTAILWVPAAPASQRPLVLARASQSVDADVLQFIQGANVGGISPLGPGEVVLVALNDGPEDPILATYVGNLSVKPLRMPPGQWWFYALGQDGRVRQSASPLILTAPTPLSATPPGLVDLPGDTAAQTRAMATLVHFTLAGQLATWLPLHAAAEARTTGSPTAAQQDSFGGLAGALNTRQDPVLAAFAVLEQGSIANGAPDLADQEPGSITVRAARGGLLSNIKDKVMGFFGSDTMTGVTARKDVEAIAQSLNPEQREELFQLARERHPINASNADEFFAQLHDGNYDTLARQLHQDFVAGSVDYAINAQQGGLRPVDTAARDGKTLVTDGAKFYADMVKIVLGAHFGADFEKGWDLAENIANRLAKVEEALKDPVGFARDLAVDRAGVGIDQITDAINGRIKQEILDELKRAGVSDADAEKLAGQIADRVSETAGDNLKTAAQTVADQVANAARTAIPVGQVPPTGGAGGGIGDPPVPPPGDPTVPANPPGGAAVTATTALRTGASVSPGLGPQGSSFILTGTGFMPGEPVAVTVAPGIAAQPGMVTADGVGTVRASLLVGTGDQPGGYLVTLLGFTSQGRATAGFTVTGVTVTTRLAPNASVFPGSGPQGSTFQISGSGFAPGESINILISYPAGGATASVNADGTGAFVNGVQVTLTDPIGGYSVTLTGRSSGGEARTAFTVTQAVQATATATTEPTRPALAPLPPVATEPYGVFIAENEVFVGQRTEIENTTTCSLRGWGLDCSKRVRDVTTLNQVLGPFPTSAAARTAFCGAYVAGSLRTAPVGAGQKAKFTFSGTELWVNNIAMC